MLKLFKVTLQLHNGNTFTQNTSAVSPEEAKRNMSSRHGFCPVVDVEKLADSDWELV